jgi:methionine synthase II (cobalamin-independent)
VTNDTTAKIGLLRADQVGSLLRPQSLKDAFAGNSEGRVGEDTLRRTQDESIRLVLNEQERHGLPIVTDGEFRRRGFQDSFGEAVSGYDLGTTTPRAAADEGEVRPLEKVSHDLSAPGPAVARRRPVKERLRLVRNLALEEYRFASALTQRPVKVALIGPDRISQRYAWEQSRHVYSGMDEFIADVVAIERQMIQELVDASCRYVQIDAPGFTAYVDPTSLEQMRSRGEDPQANFERAIAAENAVIEGFSDVTFGIHICRGNERSMWHREGHYDAIAERLFSGLNHDRLLLEYDSDRAGSFEPLRFVPRGKVAVLGLITTKMPALESLDELKRRIEEATRYLPLEQLALSPQCGFSSGLAGNLLSEADQWRKLDRMMETVSAVWR